jgi:hypothetical protein
MLQGQVAKLGVSAEAIVTGDAGLLAQQIENLYAQVDIDDPAIFAGHILIGGSDLTEDLEAEAGYSRDVWLEPSRLPHFTSYNALGHIHLIQEVRGTSKPTWYSGAPDRLNLGERNYTPQVLLVETPDTPGGTATVQPIQITTPTPFIDADLHGSEEVEAFCAHQRSGNPLGVVRVTDIDVGSRGVAEARLHVAAPKLRIRWPVEASSVSKVMTEGLDHRDVHGTVTDYLTRSFSDENRRKALLQAFEALWSEGNEEDRS